MDGMGASGVGQRHGDEGLLKYRAPDDRRAAVLPGSTACGVPQSLFLKATPMAMDALKLPPGR